MLKRILFSVLMLDFYPCKLLMTNGNLHSQVNYLTLVFSKINAVFNFLHCSICIIDISNYEMKLQKIVSVQDLTLCLDKMDTSGKIEIYQDPVLYRCSMTIRLIMSYHSNMAKQASKVRLDLHCQKMEFSITEQQIPMILRLVALLSYLQSRQYSNTRDRSSISVDESETDSNGSYRKYYTLQMLNILQIKIINFIFHRRYSSIDQCTSRQWLGNVGLEYNVSYFAIRVGQ